MSLKIERQFWHLAQISTLVPTARDESLRQ
jgi:hypothetical protein